MGSPTSPGRSRAADSVAGFLRTEGSGVFNMPAGATGVSMAVRDSAVFAGGTSTPGSGNLRIYGSFVQRGVGSSFQAGPGHNTWLAGAKPTVTFATPGITSTDSRFGQLWVARAVSGVSQPVSVTLGSPFYAVMLSDTSAGAADTLTSAR